MNVVSLGQLSAKICVIPNAVRALLNKAQCQSRRSLTAFGMTNDLLEKMKKNVLLVLLCWSSQIRCDSVSDALQARLNGIRTMSAAFHQVIYAKNREISRSSGTMALARPGHFRWQTEKPMVQWLIADGRHLWIYDVDLEQVTVKKQDKELSGTAGLFLSGYNDTVTKDFKVVLQPEREVDCFDLRAKSGKAGFQRVKLLFASNELRGIELFDQLGQHTRVQFSDIKTNPTLSGALFQFKVPKDVDVVEQ
jgi:outer membrane lipoprotein carrier protein